jgi:glycerol-3-phosphate cytidylyltransferase
MAHHRVITFGTFDLFHLGHLNIIKQARVLGHELIVGVSSDQLNFAKKNRYPICNQQQRMAIVSEIKGVSSVFLEESLALKADYIKQYDADILVMGDDWAGKFDWLSDQCSVIYLPRTPSISTTVLIEYIKIY